MLHCPLTSFLLTQKNGDDSKRPTSSVTSNSQASILTTELRQVVTNSGWLLFDRAFRLLLGLFVGAWMARYLGPSQFGELSYAIAFIALFQSIATLGLDGVVVRDLARDRNQAPAILGSVVRIRFAAGVIAWLVSIIGIVLVRPDDFIALQLVTVIGASVIFQAADTIDLWFQSQGQNRRTVGVKLFSYFIANGIKIGLILFEAPLIAFGAVTAVEVFLSATGLAYAYRRYPTDHEWKSVDVVVVKRLATQAWPYLVSSIAIYCYLRIDQIMIREMLDEAALGLYSAATTVANLWHFVPTTVAIGLAPYIARKCSEGGAAYDAALILVFRCAAVAALIISVTVAALASPLIRLLYGDEYAMAGQILTIKIFCNIPVFLGVVQSLWILNEGLGRVMLVRTALGAAAAVALNLALIPRLGLIGAAWSSLCAFVIADMIVILYYSPKIFFMQFGIRKPSLPGD